MSAIQEYNQTEAELAKLRERMKDVVYEVATTKGMEIAKADRRELVSLRTSLEAKRKELKAPALKRCQEIDTEAKRITAELFKLEEPIDAAIKAEEQRKEAEKEAKRQAELQRIAEISKKIDAIRNLPVTAVLKNAEDLQLTVDRLTAYVIDESFCEFRETATCLKSEVLVTLNNILDEKVRAAEEAARLQAEKEEQERAAAAERERIAAERAAFEEEKRSQEQNIARVDAIRAKVNAIREVYVTPGMNSEDVEALIAKVKETQITEEVYQEFAPDAYAVLAKTVSQLCHIHAGLIDSENEVAKLAEQRRVQEEEIAARQKVIDAENEKERVKIAAEAEAQVNEARRIAEEQKKIEDAKAEAERLEKERVEAEKLEADKKRAEKAANKVVEPLDMIRSVYALLCHEKKTDTQKVEVSKVMLGTYLKSVGA